MLDVLNLHFSFYDWLLIFMVTALGTLSAYLKDPQLKAVTATIPSLPQYAQEQGVTYRELRNLNPWIKNNKLTVAAGKSYTLQLPEKPGRSHKSLVKRCENPYLKLGTDPDTIR